MTHARWRTRDGVPPEPSGTTRAAGAPMWGGHMELPTAIGPPACAPLSAKPSTPATRTALHATRHTYSYIQRRVRHNAQTAGQHATRHTVPCTAQLPSLASPGPLFIHAMLYARHPHRAVLPSATIESLNRRRMPQVDTTRLNYHHTVSVATAP